MILRSIAAVACVLLGASQPTWAQASPTPDVIAQCLGCHAGAGGNKMVAPNLSGLSADYLESRMNAFLQPFSQSAHAIDHMWPISAGTDAAAKRALAEYFAGQMAPSIKLNSSSPGKSLYEQGVPPCRSCHGAQAEGSGDAPRLAGQRQEYLEAQLWAFKLHARVHGPMNFRGASFSTADIDAVAGYLAGR